MITEQKRKKLIIIVAVMLVISLTCLFYLHINKFLQNFLAYKFSIVSKKGNLIVHFIDVKEADAVAINLPDGKVLLIDDGSKDYNVDYINYLNSNVINNNQNKIIDYLVLTHADADHIGGTMKLLKNFSINTVFMPNIMSNSATFQEIYNHITQNCNYEILGNEFTLANNKYILTFFRQMSTTNTNDASQVIKLECMNKSFLFTGDISNSVEDDFINEYSQDLNCDILKVAHHGSSSSSSMEFLQAVSPKYAIISVGAKNNFGHPAEDVILRLNESGSKILRTDEKGNILFVVNNKNFIQLSGDYNITNLLIDYRVFVVILDVVLVVCAGVIIIKKEKQK